jgi:hypothetical protein
MKRSLLRLVPLALLGLAACELPTDPEPPPPAQCELPALPASFGAAALPAAQAQVALRDASTRMVSGLGSAAGAAALGTRLQQLATQVGGGERAAACTSLNAAQQSLTALPDTPGTRPDRAAIELVLHLANRTLRSLQ